MTENASPVPVAKKRTRWYMVVAILLAVVFLYLAVRNASWAEIVATVQNSQVEYLVLACLISMGNCFMRSQRWGVLVSREKQIRPMTMFWVTGIGYMGNNFLPFRAGEVIRSVVLGQKAGISKIFVMTTALTERVLDVIALVIIALLMLPLVGEMPAWLPSAMRGMALVSGAVLVGLVLAPRIEPYLITLMKRLPLPNRVSKLLENLVVQFSQGAQAFQDPRRALAFVLMTAVIWLVDGFIVILIGRAFSFHLILPQALLLLVGLGLSSAIPSTPGYIGVYQFVAVTVLGLFKYTESQALALILVSQGMNMAVVLIWGLIGFWRLGISPAELRQESNAESV